MWEPFVILERAAGDPGRMATLRDAMHGNPDTRVRLAAELALKPDADAVAAIRWRLQVEEDVQRVAETIEAVDAVNPDLAGELLGLPAVAAALESAEIRLGPGGRGALDALFDEIAQGAGSGNAEERRKAAAALADHLRRAAARDILERLILTDPHPEVVRSAVAALAGGFVTRLAEIVSRLLADGSSADPARQAWVVDALAGLAPATLGAVLRSLGAESDAVLVCLAGAWPDETVEGCRSVLKGRQQFRSRGAELVGALVRHGMQQEEAEARDRWRERLSGCIRDLRSVVREHPGVPAAAGALAALDALSWQAVTHECRRLIRRSGHTQYPDVLATACAIIGRRGGPDDVELLRPGLADPRAAVSLAAAQSMLALAPHLHAELLAHLLGHPDAAVARDAFERLVRERPAPALARLLIGRLLVMHRSLAPKAFTLIMRSLPERRDEAIDAALCSGLTTLTGRAVKVLGRLDRDRGVGRLLEALGTCVEALSVCHQRNVAARRRRLRRRRPHWRLHGERMRRNDRDRRVHAAAMIFEHLRVLTGEVRVLERAAARCLQGPSGDLHALVLAWLEECGDPAVTDLLVGLTRHPVATLRIRALAALAGRDDPRAHAALVAALDDHDGDIRSAAEKLLSDTDCPPSVKALWRDDGSGRPVWRQMRAAIEGVHRWAQGTGRHLLGSTVQVRACHGGLGLTAPVASDGVVHIEIGHEPLLTCHRHGEEILRGLALHELGHHLADFRAPGMLDAGRRAADEGLHGVFNLLLDERLERRLRSRRRDWGVLFDRLASYAFSQDRALIELPALAEAIEMPLAAAEAALRAGELPGQIIEPPAPDQPAAVLVRDIDLFRLPNLMPPLVAFTACLRCGFDAAEHPDERVAAAMALVPENLKDLPHEAMLELTRSVSAILGGAEEQRRRVRHLNRLMAAHAALRRMLSDLLRRLSTVTGLSQGAPAALGAEGGDAAPDDGPGPAAALGVRWPRGARGLPRRGGSAQANRGRGPTFARLDKTTTVPFDAEAHQRVVAAIRPHIRMLRRYLERLGMRTVEEHAARRGRRLDLARARRLPVRSDPAILVHGREEALGDAYLGIVIDRSGSMHGEEIRIARSFGVLLAESARGIRGLEGHVSAFDCETFFVLGDLRRCSAAALEAGGGNNDAGGLMRAAELALASRKQRRMIVMISDGLPTECTVESLESLVQELSTSRGVLCAQVAVGPVPQTTFPHFVNLAGRPLDEAVGRFGRMLVDLTRTWRCGS